MNVYCEKIMHEHYMKNKELFDPKLKERIEPAPVLSMEKLYKDYDVMCNKWKLQIDTNTRSHGIKGRIKQVIKRIIRKTVGWMMQPNLDMQSEYNLSIVHVMGDLLRIVGYLDANGSNSIKKSKLIICTDKILKESRIQEILLIFQYYQLFVNADASLVFLSAQLEDHLYFEFLQRTISELQLRTVQFVFSEDISIQNDYMKKADLELSLSLKEQINEEYRQVPLLQYALVPMTTEQVYYFDEIDIACISVLMKTVMDHERN